ncbi:MAG: DUF4249 domain-containing protein [Flavobacterium sp.]|nr:MAG: DUF4249 domain-containing protein [Flavobacterium sp.]
MDFKLKRYSKTAVFIVVSMLCLIACKESFSPDVSTLNNNILVVEGFINIGGDSTKFKLSRTVVVADKNVGNPESGATVTVESDANDSFPLTELATKKGTYGTSPLNLSSSKKYRLRIRSTKGNVYLSDFVEVKTTPEIEEIGWDAKPDELQIFVNTKDVSKNSVYYRWEFEETWIFYAKFQSSLIWNGQQAVYRTAEQNIFQCWGSENSNKIILGSSAKLSDDVIFQQPLILIPSHSEKLTERYSILVKQYTLTREAFEFWQNLKKNTETLGSVFDVQPSQLTGNIRSQDNAKEPVIGFVSVGNVETKRVYIEKKDVPDYKLAIDNVCVEPVLVQEISGSDFKLTFSNGSNIPISVAPNGLYASSRRCADCTIRGTNKKPTFWQ